jgi:hypothetical protein
MEVAMYRSVLRRIARTGLLICIFATSGAAPAGAAETQGVPDRKPDFSGTWTRDVKRSENPLTTGASTIVIEQTGTELKTRSAKGEARVERYRLDGSESINEERDGTKSKAIARWEGEKLIIANAVTPLTANPYTRTVTYSLASGGKELVIETATVSAADKALHYKQVWVRRDK